MFKQGRRSIVLAAAAGVLVGGLLTTVTPAGASLALNWDRIWKQEIRPHSDKRYFTKTQSIEKYYNKSQSDKRFAPYPNLIRGSFMDLNGGSEIEIDSPITFGVELATAPTAHYIKVGDTVPAGCSGTVLQPDAEPGHLCVFEQASSNLTTRGFANPATGSTSSVATFGAYLFGHQDASGSIFWFRGTWALRPGTIVVPSGVVSEGPAKNARVGNPGLTR